MKKIIIAMFVSLVMLMGCVGFSLFPNAEPLCTIEEQETSIIYKLVDPRTADFTLMLGVASILDKDPSKAALIEEVLIKAKAFVESGISYKLFAEELVDLLGPMQFVVLNPLLSGFVDFAIPMGDCDKRLILGHIENQLQLVRMVK